MGEGHPLVLGRREKTALVLLCSAPLVVSCDLNPGPSEAAQNAALRQALRADPAFKMIPAPVRASMVEVLPHSGAFTGPQTGAMGWGGSEPWDGSDPTPRVLEWGRRLESAGWTPAGAGSEGRWARAGICARDRTGAEINEGMWRKTIKGRCAWFIYGLNVKEMEYGIYTTAVGDAYGCPSPPDHPLGCGGSP